MASSSRFYGRLTGKDRKQPQRLSSEAGMVAELMGFRVGVRAQAKPLVGQLDTIELVATGGSRFDHVAQTVGFLSVSDSGELLLTPSPWAIEQVRRFTDSIR